jgi:hypothetical protein
MSSFFKEEAFGNVLLNFFKFCKLQSFLTYSNVRKFDHRIFLESITQYFLAVVNFTNYLAKSKYAPPTSHCFAHFSFANKSAQFCLNIQTRGYKQLLHSMPCARNTSICKSACAIALEKVY